MTSREALALSLLCGRAGSALRDEGKPRRPADLASARRGAPAAARPRPEAAKLVDGQPVLVEIATANGSWPRCRAGRRHDDDDDRAHRRDRGAARTASRRAARREGAAADALGAAGARARRRARAYEIGDGLNGLHNLGARAS